MKNSDVKGSRRKNRAATAVLKLFALAFCFALTFGIALTGDLWLPDGINGVYAPSNGNVAEAVATGGSTVNNVSGDHGNFKSDMFFESAATDNGRTFTETFNNTDFYNSNAVGMYANNKNTTAYQLYNDGAGMISMFREVWVTNGAGNLFVMVNYEMPAFLKNLLDAGTTVYAKMTAHLDIGNSQTGNQTGLNLFTSDERMTERYKNAEGDYFRQEGEDSVVTCDEISITSDAPYLGLGFMTGGATPGWNGTDRCKVNDIQITFRIPASPVSDGASPVLKGYNKNANAESFVCSPYRPSSENSAVSGNPGKNNTLWPVYYNNDAFTSRLPLDNLSLNKAADGSLIAPSAKAKLLSYAETAFKVDGMACYKSLTMSFSDLPATGALGISRLTVGETATSAGTVISGAADFNLEDLNSGSVSAYKTIYYVDDFTGDLQEGGKARVGKISHGSCYVELSFSQNADFKVGVYDFGDGSFFKTVNVSGIDVTAPAMVKYDQEDGIINTDKAYDKLKWLLRNNFSFSAIDETDVNEDNTSGMWLWYFTVQKGNSFDNFIDNYYETDEAVLNNQPFSIGKLKTSFDFAAGLMKGNYGDGIQTDVQNSGYYRFTFYAADAAGNVAKTESGENHINYYVKADCDGISYFIGGNDAEWSSIEYNDGINDTKYIYRSGDPANGAWANGYLTARLTFNRTSVSGNYLTFSDPAGNSYTLLFKDGNLWKIGDGDAIEDYIDIIGNEYVLEYEYDTEHNAKIEIQYDAVNRVVSFTFGKDAVYNADGQPVYPDIDYAVSFVYGVCADPARLGEGEKYTATRLDYLDEDGNNVDCWDFIGTDGKRKPGVAVRVDRNAPGEASLLQKGSSNDLKTLKQLASYDKDTSEGVYVAPTGEVFVFDGKNWFTDPKGSYAATLQCVENIGNNKDITVNVGIIINKFLDAKYEAGGSNAYDRMSSSDYWKMFGENRLRSFNKSSWGGKDTYDAEFNFLSSGSEAVGMRAVYVWATDQAGNVSGITRYYVLTDPSVYNFTVNTEHPVKGENGSVKMDDGKNTTAEFVRGQVVDFKFSFGSGFVPYQFFVETDPNNAGANKQQLLRNSIAPNGDDAGGYGPGFVWLDDTTQTRNMSLSEDGLTFTLVVEYRGEDVAKKVYENEYKGLVYTLTYRKLITIDSIVSSSEYNGGDPVVIQYPINDSAAKEFVKFFYYDAVTNEKIDEPTYLPGKVKVLPVLKGDRIIDDDGQLIGYGDTNGKYVLNGAGWSKTDFTITNRNATVAVIASESEYGNIAELTYNIDNLSPKDLVLFNGDKLGESVYLKLNGVSDVTKTHVGVYDITLDADKEFKLAHYNLTFKGAQHRITPRILYVNILSASQEYKDSESAIKFTVNSNRFVNGDEWDDIFYNAVSDSLSGTNITLRGADENLIRRAAGETVGSYKYLINNIDKFNLNANYTVVLNAGENVYKITKKTVEIYGKPGQSFAQPIGTTVDDALLGSLTLNYMFGNQTYEELYGEDAIFENARLKAGAQSGEVDKEGDDNYDIYTFFFDFSEFTGAESPNIIVAAGSSSGTFRIKVRKDGTEIDITISLKDEIVKYYGQSRADVEESIVFDKELFNVTDAAGALESYPDYTVTWDASIDDKSAYPKPDVYAVNIDNVIILAAAGGAEIPDISVEVQEFTVTYKPCEISIIPVIAQTFRTYGQPDSAYVIDFDILYPDWFPKETFENDPILKEILIVKSNVRGSFARSVFDNTGREIARGSVYDIATKADGSLVDNSGSYYGVSLGSVFGTEANYANDGYYTLKADLSSVKDVKLLINRAKIVLSREGFIGISKNYDGTYIADYGDVKAYDFVLANPSDDVTLNFVARYNEKTPGERTITFSELRLDGADIINYVLYAGEEEYAAQTFTIEFIINNDPDNQVKIEIRAVSRYEVKKTDFNIKKEYDGTTGVTSDSVIIAPENPLSTVSAKSLKTTHVFETPDVTQFHSFGSVVLFFQIPNPSENWDIVAADGEADIKVEYVDSADSDGGIKITLGNMYGAITEKKIHPADMYNDKDNKVHAVDREYNATSDVRISATPKAGVIPSVDEDKISFVFTGTTKDGVNDNMGAGNHTVTFTAAETKATGGAKASNYSVDATEFDNYFKGARQLNVNISRVKLIPNLSFTSKSYDGVDQSDIDSKNVEIGESHIIAMNPESRTAALSAELGRLRINFAAVQSAFKYSRTIIKDGKKVTVPFGGVQFDVDGNVVKHDVMVENFVITQTGDAAITGDQSANYEIPGSDWDGIAANGQISIGVYAIPNIAELNKKDVSLVSENAAVADKIYDGTDKVDIVISISGNTESNQNIIESDKDYVELYFKSRFNSASVNYSGGEVIKQGITVNGTKFVDSKDGDYSFSADGSVLFVKRAANYNLVGGSQTFTTEAYILPAPLTFDGTINLGDKVYDGSLALQKNGSLGGINYNLVKRSVSDTKTLPGLIGVDSGIYTVGFGSAGYISKNVNVNDKGEVVAKQGNVFGLLVNNSQNQTAVNYTLTETFGNKQQGRDDEIIAVRLNNKFVPYAAAEDYSSADMWCYPLPTVDYVIENTAVDNYLQTKNWSVEDYIAAYETDPDDTACIFGKIYGGRVIGGEQYYVINKQDVSYKVGSKTYTATTEIDGESVSSNYMEALGKINRKTISVVVKAKDNPNKDPYVKDYDGTNVFFGKANEDFVVDTGNASGFIAGDDVKISSDAKGNFRDIKAGKNKVYFVVTEIIGKDAYNYRVSSDNTSILDGYINKVEVGATLKDHRVEYGFNSIEQKYLGVDYIYNYDNTEYYGYGENGDIVEKSGEKGSAVLRRMLNKSDETDKLFMAKNDIEKAFPFASEIVKFIYYVDVNGTDVAVPATAEDLMDDSIIKYVQLSGSFAFPYVSPEKGVNSNTKCGDYKLTFVGNGGCDNYTFVTGYGSDADGTQKLNATLTIDKVRIYAYAKGSKTAGSGLDAYYLFERFYGQNNPALELAFADKDGEIGFRSSDKYQDIFGNLDDALIPKLHFVKYNASGEATKDYAVTDISLLSKDLEEGWYYGVEVQISDENLAALNAVLENYIVELAYGNEGISDAGSLVKNTAKLAITLPTVSNVTSNDYAQTYNGNNIIDGVAYLENMFKGLGLNVDETGVAGENEISEWSVNGEINGVAENAGAYNVTVKIVRNFAGLPNELGGIYRTDPQEYSAVLTVNKATLGMYADEYTWNVGENDGKTFDVSNIKFRFIDNGGNHGGADGTAKGLPKDVSYSDIQIITWVEDTYKSGANAGKKYFRKLADGEKMKHAGTYKITFVFNEKYNYVSEGRTDFTADGNDVNTYTNYAVYIVTPYEINIKVNSADKKKAIENGVYPDLKFDVAWDNFHGAIRPDIIVKYLGPIDGDGNRTYIDITRAGKYTYQIMVAPDTPDANDYYLSGEASGQFTVGVTSQESSLKNAVLKSNGNKVLLIDNVVYKEIFEDSAEYGEADYWDRIAKFATAIGGKGASLQSVVRLSAQFGGKKVATGDVTMTVSVPSSVKSMKNVVVYGVTPDGGLTYIDYTYANGKITYATDNVDSIAFFKLGSAVPGWAIALIVLGCLILAGFGAVIAAFFGVMNKRRRQWAALAAGNANALVPVENNPIADTTQTENYFDASEIRPDVQVDNVYTAEIYAPEPIISADDSVSPEDGADSNDVI